MSKNFFNAGTAIMSKTISPKYNPMNNTNYSKNATQNKFMKQTSNNYYKTGYPIGTQSKMSNALGNENESESGDSLQKEFQGARDRKDFINEANKIMRERMKNKGNTINSKSKFKSVVLMDTKEICLKNYLIGLLKDKRTDLNEKERNITKALRDSENKLDKDYKEFLDYVEDKKKQVKKEDEEFISFKTRHEDKENEYHIESSNNKKLCEDMERCVKMICLLRSYGSFVYKVLGMEFWFEEIPEMDQRKRNFEEVCQIILDKYSKLNDKTKQKIINDEGLLIMKFKEFENKVIKILENKEIVDKEKNNLKSNYEYEINELKKRYSDFLLEEKRIKKEKRDILNDIEKLNPQKDNEVELCLNCILELGQETGELEVKFPKNKKNINDLMQFTQETLGVLERKEKIVNGFINEIEAFEKTGDSKTLKDIAAERKNSNKREKQTLLKKKQEQIGIEKNKKAFERAQRVVIKGRKVPKDYNVCKQKVKTVTNNKNSKKDDEDLLYYSDDD